MRLVECMYFELINEVQKTIKEVLNINKPGSIRVGSCNGLYKTPTFMVPLQKMDTDDFTKSIYHNIKVLPICLLGIIEDVEMGYNVIMGETFGDASIQITITLKPDNKHLKVGSNNKNLLEIITDYAGRDVSVK